LVVALGASGTVDAAVKRWNNRFGGAFNAAANWSDGIPGNLDIAEFGVATLFTPGTYTVDFDVNPTNQAIHVEDDLVTFDLNGHTYTTTAAMGNQIGNLAGTSGRLTITDGSWNLPIVSGVSRIVDVGTVDTASGTLIVSTGGQITGNPEIVIGAGGTGTLTVLNNADIFAKHTRIGSISTGTATITGAGSTLINTSGMSVGGSGSMTISLGGFVQNTDAVVFDGFVTVRDFNSRWNTLQQLSITSSDGTGGQLNVANGGRVDSVDGNVGFAGIGHATVGDASPGLLTSQWINAGELWIGASKLAVPGSGTLDIRANGRVQNTDALIATGANSVGIVTLEHSSARWINSSNLTIGDGGDGTLNIMGGLVQNIDGVIADESAATGTVVVSGPNSVWTNTGFLIVGQGGEGSLSVHAGGTVTSTVGVVGNNFGSHGIATIDGVGSSWATSSNLGIGDGTLTISGGATVTTNGLFGTLADASTAEAEVNVVGGSIWNLSSALLAVGDDGTATLNILDSGNVFNLDALVGADPSATGTVLVSGAGSDWISSGNLTIGDAGVGTMNIKDAGSVSSGSGIVGNLAGALGTANIDGPNSIWSNAGALRVGNLGQGSMTVSNGGQVSNTDAEIGEVDGIVSSVVVDGAGSEWNNSASLDIGDIGDGSLTISNGGTVTSASGELADGDAANGFVTITGVGSTWSMSGGTGSLLVGDDGTGMLHILNGGALSNVESDIGNAINSTGTALVSGAASGWTMVGTLTVGNFGDGTLTIDVGGSVGSESGFVGTFENSTGDVTVSGVGSTWDVGSFFAVGNFGAGTMTIEAGGTVNTPRSFIGRGAVANGIVTVSGAGSTWTSSEVFLVGDQGAAQLSITDGGSVLSNDAWIAGANTGNATVTVAGPGSNWMVAGRLAISEAFDPDELPGGGTGTLRIQPGGTVIVAGETALVPGATVFLEGGTLDTGSVSFTGGGTFNFVSGTLHVGAFGADLVNQGGTLAPGHSAGSTTINGLYAQQPGGTLEVEIGGIGPGTTHDLVSITSLAAISGQLQLGLLDSFVPAASDAFTVFTTSTGIFGAFSNVANGGRLVTFDDLGSFQVNYGPGSAFNPNHIVLSNFIPNTLPGDFNDDGTVDAADFVMWRKLNSNSAAYATWRQHFREALPGGGSSAFYEATPEPTSLVLLAVAVAAPLRRRRRTAIRVGC
jgi:T5SS/PEP-CTERM-associated repeat protein